MSASKEFEFLALLVARATSITQTAQVELSHPSVKASAPAASATPTPSRYSHFGMDPSRQQPAVSLAARLRRPSPLTPPARSLGAGRVRCRRLIRRRSSQDQVSG